MPIERIRWVVEVAALIMFFESIYCWALLGFLCAESCRCEWSQGNCAWFVAVWILLALPEQMRAGSELMALAIDYVPLVSRAAPLEDVHGKSFLIYSL